MKHTFGFPFKSRHLVLLTVALLLLGLTGLAIAKPSKPPCHPHCDDSGNTSSVKLIINYDFDGMSSEVTTTGTKQCDEQGRCNFNGDIDGSFVPFYLPDSLIDGDDGLLAGTSWRGTPLDPDMCFEGGYADAAGRGVELSYDYNAGTWFTAIGSYARDVYGALERKYVFYFLCDSESCVMSAVSPPSMAGFYTGGRLLRIEADPKDRGGKSTPCRCTISSEPPCPGSTEVSLSLTVTEAE